MTGRFPAAPGGAAEAIPAALRNLLERTLDPEAPEGLKMTAARGALPVPQAVLLRILVTLRRDRNPGVAAAADATLGGFGRDPVRLCALLDQPATDPGVLDFFGSRADGNAQAEIQRSVVVHPNTPEATLARLAAAAAGEVLDSIFLNEDRLVRTPDLLVPLRSNPHLSPGQVRRIQEIEAQLVRGGLRGRPEAPPPAGTDAAPPDPAQGSAPLAGTGPVPEPEALEAMLNLEAGGLPQDLAEAPADAAPAEEAPSGPAVDRIARMTVPEKIQLTVTADLEERMILIRDPNRKVALAVLHSPKINEKDVAAFASLRNVEIEVLRQIGTRRDWLRSYAVAHALVENPKTPAGIAVQLLPRLQTSDLRLLSRNRNVSEAVRRGAGKAYQARTQPAAKDARGGK